MAEEGKGFRYLLDGLNAERILIAAECIGDDRWFIERSAKYASDRVVFGRPIGQNQGIQFPIAQAHIQVEAADLMRMRAANLFDRGSPVAPRPIWPSCWLLTLLEKLRMSPFRPTAGSALRRSTISNASLARPDCAKSHRSQQT